MSAEYDIVLTAIGKIDRKLKAFLQGELIAKEVLEQCNDILEHTLDILTQIKELKNLHEKNERTD